MKQSMLGRRFGTATFVVALITACANGDSGVPDDSDGGMVKKDATTGGNCPNQEGSYSITTNGQCGDLSTGSTCVKQSTCSITMTGSLSGGASIGNTGAFSNASFTAGTTPESGCSGVWSAGSSTLTVTCGMCVATLTRTSPMCAGNMCSMCNIDLDCQNTCGTPPQGMTWCCDTGMNSCYPAQACQDQDAGGTD